MRDALSFINKYMGKVKDTSLEVKAGASVGGILALKNHKQRL
jgi:hypothetical protein